MKWTAALLLGTAGLAHANGAVPSPASAGHAFINPATGEVILNSGRGAELITAWATGGTPCADVGADWNGLIYTADGAPGSTPGEVYMDWGDAPAGMTVVASQFEYATDYADPDASGVPGFGLRVSFYDAENGVGSPRTELGSVALSHLWGDTGELGFPTVWTVIVGHEFQIGDTDLDGDGLSDFGYSIEFIHPEGQSGETYLVLHAPDGVAAPDGQGGWTVGSVAPLPAAQGTEDAADVYTRDGNGDLVYERSIGGTFSCDPANPQPFMQIGMTLFTAEKAEECAADLVGADGVNIFDLIEFVQLYSAGDPGADFAPSGGDGLVNIFDLLEYTNLYVAGCP